MRTGKEVYSDCCLTADLSHLEKLGQKAVSLAVVLSGFTFEASIMEDNPDYDTLLRSIFDSCDTTGSGLISTTEFEDLCAQLSLQVSL